ncbi:MAG: TetR/AcrR family transcriptional regulator [Chloroflexi bacterium]|nr:TetR/AcrR family transcriptional regulator [Chloroflexota bacterium]
MVADEKAQRILDAARTILAQQGYMAMTVSQVAETAGVSRGLLHYYFKNKEDLLARVIRSSLEKTVELVQLMFAQSATADEIATGLTGALRYLDQVAPDVFNLLFEGWAVARQSELVAAEMAELFRQFHAAMLSALEEAAARGVIAPTVPLDGLAVLLSGLMDGLALQVITTPELVENDAVWHTTQQAVLGLLGG